MNCEPGSAVQVYWRYTDQRYRLYLRQGVIDASLINGVNFRFDEFCESNIRGQYTQWLGVCPLSIAYGGSWFPASNPRVPISLSLATRLIGFPS